MLVTVAALSASTLGVKAQERERAGIVLGAFLTHRDSETRLDSDSGLGTDIDLEGDLGLKSTIDVARFGGYVWFKKRQRFDFSYFDLSRSASRRIDKTIVFGDQTFNIDTVISSDESVSITKADYTFAPISRDRGFLGVTGGLYVGQLKYRISEPSAGRIESKGLTAPLPVVGFRGEYEITDRITVGGASQWFSIDTGDASGRLHDIYIGGDYRFGKRIGVGLAYNTVSMNIKADDGGGFIGRLDWGYDGWLLYIKADLGKR